MKKRNSLNQLVNNKIVYYYSIYIIFKNEQSIYQKREQQTVDKQN